MGRAMRLKGHLRYQRHVSRPGLGETPERYIWQMESRGGHMSPATFAFADLLVFFFMV